MLDFILAPMEYSFMWRALIGSILVGVMCPVVGAYVITRNLAFIGDALAHAVLPGMVVGFIVGFSPAIAAVPTGITIAVLIRTVSRKVGLSTDTSIGILFAAMFALGLVLLAATPTIRIDIESLLLGQLLGISPTTIYVSLAISALVVLGLFAFHQWLMFASFDPMGSRVMGFRANFADYLLMVMLALVIVLGIQAAGIVLVMAMLVTPAATAYLLVRRFVSIMLTAAVIGTVASVSGLYLSYYYNLPAGPAMTLVASGIFIVVALFRRRVTALE